MFKNQNLGMDPLSIGHIWVYIIEVVNLVVAWVLEGVVKGDK